MRNNTLTLALTSGLLWASVSWADSPLSLYEDEVRAGVEEIYVFRTTRTASERGSTPACSAAPFASIREDHYDLWSVQLRAKDARIVKTHEKAVGDFSACFGQAAAGQPLTMYASGRVAQVTWSGIGECRAVESQPRVHTVVAFNCELNLSGLPDGYTGGFLVSSTVAPVLGRDQPPTAHVPGYLSTSVVTLRLWIAADARIAPRTHRRPGREP